MKRIVKMSLALLLYNLALLKHDECNEKDKKSRHMNYFQEIWHGWFAVTKSLNS